MDTSTVPSSSSTTTMDTQMNEVVERMQCVSVQGQSQPKPAPISIPSVDEEMTQDVPIPFAPCHWEKKHIRWMLRHTINTTQNNIRDLIRQWSGVNKEFLKQALKSDFVELRGWWHLPCLSCSMKEWTPPDSVLWSFCADPLELFRGYSWCNLDDAVNNVYEWTTKVWPKVWTERFGSPIDYQDFYIYSDVKLKNAYEEMSDMDLLAQLNPTNLVIGVPDAWFKMKCQLLDRYFADLIPESVNCIPAHVQNPVCQNPVDDYVVKLKIGTALLNTPEHTRQNFFGIVVALLISRGSYTQLKRLPPYIEQSTQTQATSV